MASTWAISEGLSVKDRRILAAFSTTAAALSLAGSAFIVLCYILFKELRKFSFKLVFFLALSDMFCSFFSIVGDPSNGLFCYAQDYSAHFFCIASFLWTTTIAFTLHRTVVKHKTDVEDFGSIFHLYVWGTSFAMTVLLSIGSNYGQSGAWCWTGAGKKEKVVHLITFYTPLWGAILYNGLTYYQVNRMLSNATRMAVGISDSSYRLDSGAGRKAVNKWGYYPLILIGSWTFATINRILDFVYPEHKIFWLSLADVWFAGLMGLFNSIAYGLNSSVRRAITERLDLYLPEKVKSLFPQSLKGQQQEQELVSLMVEGQ
ncbi:hypothetical protein KFK09_024698 [Dendrobium nobile]|uniref:G-protein coupled receptors family 2 profile 2 domain-containing protein n=1 Tax=Dendrobium nobile TaxID=94219 RepID=A0A8T3AEG5_DENNO|nr:hypothetical protein KFK09_024698 [Dendrobium nobile]